MHNSLCSIIESAGLELSASGLNQRFNQEGVDFLKGELEALIGTSTKISERLKSGLSKKFKRVIVVDSTSWQLHKKLEDRFGGCGGDASPAGIKVQVFLDALSSVLTEFEVTSGDVPDQKYAPNISEIFKKDDLALFDLGYFKLSVLSDLIKQGTSFVSRYLHGTTVLIPSSTGFKTLDLFKLLKKLKENQAFEFDIYLGAQDKLPCRMVATRLPKDEANEKIRKLRENAKKKGKILSKREIVFAQWNIFVTNTDASVLTAIEVTQTYRLRWSIELLFKQFKSTLNLHRWNHGNEYRIQCEILGTLIVAAILMIFHGLAQALIWREDQYHNEISVEKLFKLFKNNAYQLLNALKLAIRDIRALFKNLLTQILKKKKKESRKSRPSTMHSVSINTRKITCKTLKNKALLRFVLKKTRN